MASTSQSTSASTGHSAIAENVITSLNRSLTELRETLSTLTEGSVQTIKEDSEKHINNQLRGVVRKMKASDETQKAEADELNQLIRQVLEEELVESLAQIIQDNVLVEIDDLVHEQVRAQLPHHLPDALQKELRRHKEELAQLEIELHNAESTRQNATLPMDPTLKLFQLVTPLNGVSEKFPKTLGELFNLSEEDAVLLLHAYGRTDSIVPNSREKNVNEFMRLCGVQYYLSPANRHGGGGQH